MRKFRREVQGTWVYQDTPSLEAKEIFPVLDQLVYLLAVEHYGPGESESLEDVVHVELASADGVTRLDVGRTAAGEVRAQVGARQSKLRAPDLHGMLLAIASK